MRTGMVASSAYLTTVVLSWVETQLCVRRVKILVLCWLGARQTPAQPLSTWGLSVGKSRIQLQVGFTELQFTYMSEFMSITTSSAYKQWKESKKKEEIFCLSDLPQMGFYVAFCSHFVFASKPPPLDVRARQCSQQKKACLQNAAIQVQ